MFERAIAKLAAELESILDELDASELLELRGRIDKRLEAFPVLVSAFEDGGVGGGTAVVELNPKPILELLDTRSAKRRLELDAAETMGRDLSVRRGAREDYIREARKARIQIREVEELRAEIVDLLDSPPV